MRRRSSSSPPPRPRRRWGSPSSSPSSGAAPASTSTSSTPSSSEPARSERSMEVSWLHLIPLLPLIGAAICGIAGKWLPKPLLYAVALCSVLLSFCIGLYAFVHLGQEAEVFHELAFNWFS